MGAHVEGMSILTRLETMEQELIQHIRTSGLSQYRELSLIDEVMNIRLRAEISCLSDRMVCEEKQHQEALAGKEQEHMLKLSKLDERIRRVLAAKGGDILIHPYLSPSTV